MSSIQAHNTVETRQFDSSIICGPKGCRRRPIQYLRYKRSSSLKICQIVLRICQMKFNNEGKSNSSLNERTISHNFGLNQNIRDYLSKFGSFPGYRRYLRKVKPNSICFFSTLKCFEIIT